jgi:chemotaxis protein methyltransferase CheR
MKRTALLKTESSDLRSFLEQIRQQYGYEFGDYQLGALRRVQKLIEGEAKGSGSGFRGKRFQDPSFVQEIVAGFSTGRRVMFRNPSFYRAFRTKVVPFLRTYPSVRIWFAGCASGEELYGLSILLHEEGVSRFRIYATDSSELQLKKASRGTFTLAQLENWEKNYRQSDGKRTLAAYYSVQKSKGVLHDEIKRNIVFFHHNLATDASFHEFQAILCRNTMAYFNAALKQRVHGLLFDSLCKFGVLGLGLHESIQGSKLEDRYAELDPKNKLYIKRSPQ